MTVKYSGVGAVIIAALLCGTATVQAQEAIEVMHEWTSGGEAHALQAIKDALAKQGVSWIDSAVAGGGGTNKKQALQARFASGNPPAAVSVQAQDILAYAATGDLGDVDAVADKAHFADVIAPEILPYLKYDGHYVAVPIGEHRENMLWINGALLDKVGGKPPTTWPEFEALADKFKAAGVIPLALGGDDWQEGEIFSDILIGTEGKDFFKKSIIDLDPAALSGPEMVKVFDEFRKVLSYADANRAGRDWDAATQMVISGQAGMQFQGDWAKGEFALAKMTPGKDFYCVSAPGNDHLFTWELDSFAFFKQNDDGVRTMQNQLATVVIDPAVQETFNLRKGSIPIRVDADASKFDACAQTNLADRKIDEGNGGMVGSFIEDVSVKINVRGALLDVITQFANTPSMSSQDAATKLGQVPANL